MLRFVLMKWPRGPHKKMLSWHESVLYEIYPKSSQKIQARHVFFLEVSYKINSILGVGSLCEGWVNYVKTLGSPVKGLTFSEFHLNKKNTKLKGPFAGYEGRSTKDLPSEHMKNPTVSQVRIIFSGKNEGSVDTSKIAFLRLLFWTLRHASDRHGIFT